MATSGSRIRCCDPCRLLHYKCDGRLPQCSRCARTGRACVRVRKVQFRLMSGPSRRTRFPRNQVWLRLPQRVDFVLEPGSNGQSPLDGAAANGSQRWESTTSPESDPVASRHVSNHLAGVRTDNSEQSRIPSQGLANPSQVGEPPPAQTLPADNVPLQLTRSVGYQIDGRRRSKTRTWPLRDPQEARLLQHFVDKVSPFFDCSDRERHFAIHVPHRARYCETLFNAILAMSARHLSRTTSFDPFVSDHYYHECLETLIPALDDQEVATDDDLLAATVILRLLEEFDVPIAGSDLRGHSFGTKAFIQAQRADIITPSLRQATYWSGLRQEIYSSLSLQRPPDIELSAHKSDINLLANDADDCVWANQAIAHCADVLLFCYGEARRSATVHAELLRENRRWRESRPPSFDPYFVDDGDAVSRTGFPDIKMHADWHAIGNQYNSLARILLLVHDPTIPTVGPLRRTAMERVDEEIKAEVWTMCGVGMSNASAPPAIITACMAINPCGDRFTDKQQQNRLMEVLVRTDALHGWPTRAIQEQLRETWGWN
ncbi:hypothetical protein VTN96DRAFT_8553 [Rasamsonia emersonii]